MQEVPPTPTPFNVERLDRRTLDRRTDTDSDRRAGAADNACDRAQSDSYKAEQDRSRRRASGLGCNAADVGGAITAVGTSGSRKNSEGCKDGELGEHHCCRECLAELLLGELSSTGVSFVKSAKPLYLDGNPVPPLNRLYCNILRADTNTRQCDVYL